MDDSIDWSKAMPRKISVRIGGHATSVSLEQPFLDILKAIAHKKGQSLAFIIRNIDSKRPQKVNLSASLRVYALQSILTQNL
ncbi:putative DNA-binding ribbon-helix-helix protein [Bartonella callosciuri]|uniref:Putative DNA-binding ribbon-helix-helix protein n=1 Tax=Bartonella callosciuri TaxID=686223 RepID=A0A840NMN7_9HYPH|nr:ribbon-helix-helix domain-containing protein [Bartonella callosciuri]MBB5073140.1 putative DNA-binding ribbon-helix-helix protein [Bartonella callosciuri]